MEIVFVRRRLLMAYIGILSLIAMTTSCQMATGGEKHHANERISGISFVAASEALTAEDVTPITRLGTTWVSLMPYGFVRKTENIINYNIPWQWLGERDAGLIEASRICKQEGLKIMIKPQIWLRHGEYTGDYFPPDSSITVFKDSFEKFVLHYAQLSQDIGADMYCIGTEWRVFVNHDPKFWRQLIKKVKKVYAGPLTYAANWDEYKSTPFWHELDYIGVNAYFPLSNKDHPDSKDLEEGWQHWKDEMQAIASTEQRPILFTEYGYRSTVKNASKPWESYTKLEVSLKNQQIAYEALYNQFWQKQWFAGGFAWKWFHNHDQEGGVDNIDYTPQNKPVEELIRVYYSKPE